MTRALPFTEFAERVLRVSFTTEQRVLSKVSFDGVDPIDLSDAERGIARKLFGDVDRIPDDARHVIAWLKGARMGGTWMCSLYLVYAALTADLSGLAAGEQAFAPIVAPDLKTARQGLRFALGAAQSAPSIARCIESSGADGFTIRRPDDGRCVSIECLAASRGGASLRGRTMVAALMDESSFFRDPDAGVVNDSEIYRAIVVRILPGGKCCVISTAWLQSGLLWQLIQDNHGKPRACVAAIAPTLLVRNVERIRVIVEQERLRDPRNAAREFDCEPFDSAEAAFFDPRAIASSVDEALILPVAWNPETASEFIIGIGGDFAFRRNSSALAVVQRDADDLYTLVALEERTPHNGPLKPSQVCREFATVTKGFGAEHVRADGHYRESISEHLESADIYLVTAPEGATGKAEVYVRARTLLHEGCGRIPNHARLLKQLREVTSRPLPGGGMSFSSPTWRTGEHGDLVSAYLLAMWEASLHQRPARPVAEPERGSLEWRKREQERTKKRKIERVKRRCSDDWALGGPELGGGFGEDLFDDGSDWP